MVKRLFKSINGEFSNIHDAAYLLAIFAFLSQILGLFRDRLLAHYFGAGVDLDIYYASFRIPDLIFVVVASMVSSSVLIPLIQEKIKNEKEGLKNFIDQIFSAFAVSIIAVSIVVFFFMPKIIDFIYSDVGLEFKNSVVSLSRILLLSPIFLGFSNFLGSVIQSHNRFALYALSPVVYNISIIIGLIFFFPSFGISGVVFGVVLGSILHALIQVPFSRKISLFPDLIFPINWKIAKNVASISLPRTIALASSNLTILFLVSLASSMREGSISVFNLSFNLQSVPMTIIGVSFSMAAFPTLATLFASGDKKKFITQMASATKQIIFFSLPITALFIVLRAQIVRTVLGTGAFSWGDTRLTAACFALFAISAVAQSLNLLLVRAYYASGKTLKPLFVNITSAIFSALLAFVFYKAYLNYDDFRLITEYFLRIKDVSGTEVVVLAFGYTLGSILNLIMFLFIFESDFNKFFSLIRKTFVEGIISSFATGISAYLALNFFSNIFDNETLTGIFAQGLSSGLVGLLFGFIVLKILKSKDLEEFISHMSSKIWKAKPIAPEQSDI